MKHKRIVATASMVVVIGLGFQAYSLWPKLKTDSPEVLPTKQISKDQRIGGAVEQNDTSRKNNFSSNMNNPERQSIDQGNLEPDTDIAPRQTEIKRSTPVEYEYKALRTSNDPLQQPAWTMSTLKTQTAWDITTGNGVVVAVIDSGFALNHEDLTNQWFTNAGENGSTKLGDRCWTGIAVSKQSNNCDDDNNGYRDDWRGWDFAGVNNSPQAGDTDPNGAGVAHGTEVAGLVGATGNNGIGTMTMSWNNKIMPLQALQDSGSGFTSSITAAVRYAVDNGASVINMSLGGDTNDPTLANAIKYAYDRGVVVVAAAGNCGTGSEQGCDPAKPGAMGYPALNPYVISVGATTSANARASFSSYGPGLDVTAPGSGNLISPMWRSNNQTSAYATSLYGTSFASPIVASYVGLIKSLRPGNSVDDILALIDATASKPAAMASEPYNVQYGHGIIDIAAGLRVAASLNQNSAIPELSQAGSNVSEHSYTTASTLASGCKTTANSYCTVWARNTSGYERFLPYALTDGSGQVGWSWPGTWLGNDEWQVRAKSGTQNSTTPYQLLSK